MTPQGCDRSLSKEGQALVEGFSADKLIKEQQATIASLQGELEAVKAESQRWEDGYHQCVHDNGEKNKALAEAERERSEYNCKAPSGDEECRLKSGECMRHRDYRIVIEWTERFKAERTRREEAERRLSEALAAVKDLAIYRHAIQGHEGFFHRDCAEPLCVEYRTVLAEGTAAETENPRREPGA